MHATLRLIAYSMALPLALALVFAACSADKPAASGANAASGEKAGEIILADAALLEQLVGGAQGKVAVLNFWATWCPPCVKEMPDLAKFYKHFSPGEVVFISLSANDAKMIDEELKPYIEENKLPFPVYVLNASDPAAFYKALRVELSGALPATIIYGKDGMPKQVWERDTTFDELKQTVEAML